MYKLLAVFVVAIISPLLLSRAAHALSPYNSGSTGYDVSYPNCSAKNPGGAFGIVGVNGGMTFSQNTCLTLEAGWFKNMTFYVNTGYPGSSRGINYQNSPKACSSTDVNCLAYNYGYNAGLYAVSYAGSQNSNSSAWWLDVETMNTWTGDANQNRQSLQGEYDALSANGASTIGAYSTTYQWNTITGSWKNNWPSWGATTWSTAKQAAKYCTGHEFTGGPTYLIQFSGRIDQDYAC